MEFYEHGNIKIEKNKLHDLLSKMESGKHYTKDILEKYQGAYHRNEGIPAGGSWNAHFGKILKKCEDETNGSIIKELKSNQTVKVDGKNTNNSRWEII